MASALRRGDVSIVRHCRVSFAVNGSRRTYAVTALGIASEDSTRPG